MALMLPNGSSVCFRKCSSPAWTDEFAASSMSNAGADVFVAKAEVLQKFPEILHAVRQRLTGRSQDRDRAGSGP